MKRIKIDPQAIKERLEKNKEKGKKGKRDNVTIEQNPIFKVAKEGTYGFRAVHYPHSEDPVAEPFPVRHYHYGVKGDYIVYCPQMNDGEPCVFCDFLWDEMKKNKGTPRVKVYSDKLPKATLWIPGKARGREEEGAKFLKIGTRADKMSENHEKIFDWFNGKSTANWLDPDSGLDMIVKYEEYDEAKAKQLKTKIGLKSIDLERDDSAFGDDFETFEVPNIDESDDPTLKAYRKRTSKEMVAVLDKWIESLPTSKETSSSSESDADTGEASEDSEVSEEDLPATVASKDSSKEASIKDRLKKMGVKV